MVSSRAREGVEAGAQRPGGGPGSFLTIGRGWPLADAAGTASGWRGIALTAGGAGVGAGAGAAAFTATAVGASSAGGGGGFSVSSAQPMPASAKSAAPTAGSQSGVRGSGGGGGWACAGSDMDRRGIDYETDGGVKQRGLRPGTRYPLPTVLPRSVLPLLFGLGFSAAALAPVLVPAVAHAGPLAPLPGTTLVETATPVAAPSPAERLSRGVVTVEQGGRVVAVGAVLSGDGDGRILTALSPLGTAELVDVRYADGSVVHAKIGHRDRAWDLALLVPQTGKWVDGLAASMANPLVETLEAPVALHPGRPVVVAAHVRGLVDARAKDGSSVLSSALDVELQGAVPTLGAPVTDGSGGVVGVFVKACQATLPVVAPSTGAAPLSTPAPAPPPPPPCVPLVVAAPVAAIRDFLSHTPPTAVTPTPGLGINGVPDTESNTHGVRVVAVAPDSPAQKGGLKASEDRTQADLIVAVDGQPVDTPEHLAEIIGRHAIGARVKLLLMLGGKFHETTVVLRAAP